MALNPSSHLEGSRFCQHDVHFDAMKVQYLHEAHGVLEALGMILTQDLGEVTVLVSPIDLFEITMLGESAEGYACW